MPEARLYRFFDLCIESELPLPGLAGCAARRADWTVALPDHGRDVGEPEWFHTWRSPAGEALMTTGRRGAEYVLGFPGLARFTVDFEARLISALPLAECTASTLAHLLLDQALPRVVCHQGRMVVHASAIQLEDGRALAFTGVSGRGKSTLASAFYRAGCRLLSDDCLLLEHRAGGVFVIPAYASVRLWPDSVEALFAREEQERLRAAPMAHYTSKKVLQAESAGPAALVVPLQALYLLEPPETLTEGAAVRIEDIGGMAAIMSLVEAQFALDVVDKAAIKRGFAAVSEVAGHVPIHRLAYPRIYQTLPAVINKILETV